MPKFTRCFFWIAVVALNALSCKQDKDFNDSVEDKKKEGVKEGLQERKFLQPIEKGLRGVWLARTSQGHFESKEKLGMVVKQLKTWKFNTIFPVVYTAGHTLYPSDFFKSQTGLLLDFHPTLRGRDVMAEILEEARKQSIAVVPWFEYGFMVPVSSDLGRKKQNWMSRDATGKFSRVENGVEMTWMNILKPEVQAYFVSLFSEFVEKYNLGTFQVDDHFGIPREFLSDGETKAQYRKEKGSSAPLLSQTDPAWNDFHAWKIEKVTAAVGAVSSALKQKYPGLKISLSPNPLEFSKKNFHQDWKVWLEKGIVDNISLQVYRDDSTFFQREIDSVLAQIGKEKLHIGILAGVTSKVLPKETSKAQKNLVESKQIPGVIFFSYDAMINMPSSKFNPGETSESRRLFWNSLF